jgi:hypothetical protein
MFESPVPPLVSRRLFLRRVTRNAVAAGAFLAFSLAVGTVGYHHFGNIGWLDGFLNASMILTGMGPVDKMESAGGKLFAAFYALYSGVGFLTTVVVLLAPIHHRLLHKFHLDAEEDARRRHARPHPPTPPPAS